MKLLEGRLETAHTEHKSSIKKAHVLCYIRHMARGESGRVVLEIDPALKHRLHVRMAEEQRSLKDWFIEQASRYLGPAEKDPQQSLPFQQTGTGGRNG